MNFLENIRTAMSAISANKLHSLLTMLGVIIGVYAVSTMLALGQMATGAITRQLDQIGGSQVFISPRSELGRGNVQDFSQDDLQALAALPVQNLSSVGNSLQISTALRAGNVGVEGVTARYPEQVGNLKLRYGRFFSESEARGSAPVLVLAENTARKYLGPGNPVGKTVRVTQNLGQQGSRREQFTVIGIVANEGGLLGNLSQDSGFLPIQYAWRYFYTRDHYPYLMLKISSGADKARVQADIKRILTSRRGRF